MPTRKPIKRKRRIKPTLKPSKAKPKVVLPKPTRFVTKTVHGQPVRVAVLPPQGHPSWAEVPRHIVVRDLRTRVTGPVDPADATPIPW
jgi:hypothetical protein